MRRLRDALQALVNEDYDAWGGVNDLLREAVTAFHVAVNAGGEICEPVVIPHDAD